MDRAKKPSPITSKMTSSMTVPSQVLHLTHGKQTRLSAGKITHRVLQSSAYKIEMGASANS
jgi:hypothetical protein